jgi:hypothetical protein
LQAISCRKHPAPQSEQSTMSDDQRTPAGTARVNSERFHTELEAVWYAANYYYESSYLRKREYTGIVFQDGEKVGITVRGDGTSSHAYPTADVPHGTTPLAIWHTHLPASMSGEYPALNQLYALLLRELTGEILEHTFSTDDHNTWVLWTRKFGRLIPVYLVTAKIIKRYTGPNRDKVWVKDPPSRMQNIKGLP